ncbi:alpha/beta hydrolase [Streptomyces sp. NPDC058001]|uniref:alpha/beta hydrolase n=1 Tax=Streptomyces sp. NPDC058001 TaxID=3346300 RepID=UPI0036F0B56E
MTDDALPDEATLPDKAALRDEVTPLGEAALLDKAVQMFVAATPPVGAPIEDWRAGFEAMCAQFELPADAAVEELSLGGVPARRVTAPGATGDGVILHFHSGGYVMGSSWAYREFAHRLSAVAGVPVIVPDYRLAPELTFPHGAVEDALTAYRALLETQDARRIVVSGDSAGGGLAMSTLLSLRDAGDPLPVAGFAISPLLDLAGEGESCVTNDGVDPLIDRAMIVDMGKVYIGDLDPKEHPAASPLYGEHHGLPPLLLLASDSEVLRDDAVRFAASVRAAGGRAEVNLTEGMIHIWTIFPFLQRAGAALEDIGGFVRTHLN